MSNLQQAKPVLEMNQVVYVILNDDKGKISHRSKSVKLTINRIKEDSNRESRWYTSRWYTYRGTYSGDLGDDYDYFREALISERIFINKSDLVKKVTELQVQELMRKITEATNL